MLTPVFVYGTLRQNQSNHSYMVGTKLISPSAYLYGELWDTGHGYPALVLSGHSKAKVYGELYLVNTEQLQTLDELEDYYGPDGDNEYDRVMQTVYTLDQSEDRSYSAYVYIYTHPPENGVLINSGDWKSYMNPTIANPEEIQ